MSHRIVELDHLMCGVDHPQAAGAAIERMGFKVTPLSILETMGLANRCVLFPSRTPGAASYLELMGIVTPARVPENMIRTLSGGERVKSMVMATDDCDACYADLSAGGFAPPTPPVHLTREWELGPNEVVQAAFAVLLPMPAPLTFNVCQHKTLPLYLRPDWTMHPNTAIGFTSVIAYSPDPAATIGFFERLFGTAARRDPHGLLTVSPANAALRVGDASEIASAFGGASAEGEAAQFLGIGIRVTSIVTLRAHLEKNQVPHTMLDQNRILVAASAGCGNLIEFTD